MTMFIYCLYDG